MLQTETIVAVGSNALKAPIKVSETVDSLSTATTDTLANASNAAADSIHHVLLANLGDSVQTGPILHINEWPVTLWGDTITPPHSLFELSSAHGSAIPYNILQDNCVLSILIGCFLLVVLTISFSREYLKEQFRSFFAPPTSKKDPNAIKKASEIYTPAIMFVALCASNGLLLFAAASKHFNFNVGSWNAGTLLALCIGCFAAYNIVRWCLYGFINWIFFRGNERRLWRGGYAFLLTIESLLLFPITLVSLNTDWNIKTTAICTIITLGLTRILLLYQSFRIFFPKNYGLLHLIAYLCTLELLPLLTLWKALEYISSELLVKY